MISRGPRVLLSMNMRGPVRVEKSVMAKLTQALREEVAGLPAGARVEIECIAVRP